MTQREIRDTLAGFGIRDLIRKPAEMDWNTYPNYKVSAREGTYVLKYIHRPGEHSYFEYLGALHEMLHARRIPVPKMIRTIRGGFVYKSCVLYEFLDGKVARQWTDNGLRSLAENVARVTIALGKIKTPALVKQKKDKYALGLDIVRIRKNILPRILRTGVSASAKREISEILLILEKGLRDYGRLPRQISHNDVNESNALFKKGRFVGIIDFTLGYEAAVYDLAVTLYWYAFPWWNDTFYPQRYQTIIRAYGKVRGLSRAERRLIPFLMLRRAYLSVILPFLDHWSGEDRRLDVKKAMNRLARARKFRQVLASHKLDLA